MRIIFFLYLVCASFFSHNLYAQGNSDYTCLKNINPSNPDNPIFKTLSSSTYPICFSLPVGMLTLSLINKDEKGKKVAFEIAGGLLVTATATGILKKLVNRPRPYETYDDIYPDVRENGNSFPSGHTSMAFSTATSLMLTTKKWYFVAPAYAWAVSVGYSRMYLGQHYPSDVIAGAVVGAGGAYLTHLINSKWLHKDLSKKKKVQVP